MFLNSFRFFSSLSLIRSLFVDFFPPMRAMHRFYVYPIFFQFGQCLHHIGAKEVIFSRFMHTKIAVCWLFIFILSAIFSRGSHLVFPIYFIKFLFYFFSTSVHLTLSLSLCAIATLVRSMVFGEYMCMCARHNIPNTKMPGQRK